MSRFFFGIEIPTEVKKVLRLEQQRLQMERIEAKGWSNPELLHLTLLFIGGLDAEQVTHLHQVGHEVAATATPFPLTTAKFNLFPLNKVLWLGFEEKGGHLAKLTQLHQALKAALQPKLVVEWDERPYKPHLTLARKVKDATRLKKITPPPAVTVQVTEICLFESLREDGQLVYPIRARYPFASPANEAP